MGPRILIVEDEENVAYVIGTALRLAGFAISETSSGRDASAARLRSCQSTSTDDAPKYGPPLRSLATTHHRSQSLHQRSSRVPSYDGQVPDPADTPSIQ